MVEMAVFFGAWLVAAIIFMFWLRSNKGKSWLANL